MPKPIRKTKSKYSNRVVEYDGYKFDSVAELRVYKILSQLLEDKKILMLRLQPRYELQSAFQKNGKKYRKIEYVADFEVHHLDGSIEVIDVKGMKTTDFKIKQKLFDRKYPMTLTLIDSHHIAKEMAAFEKAIEKRAVLYM